MKRGMGLVGVTGLGYRQPTGNQAFRPESIGWMWFPCLVFRLRGVYGEGKFWTFFVRGVYG